LLVNPAQTVTSLSCTTRASVTAMADSDGTLDDYFDHSLIDSKSDDKHLTLCWTGVITVAVTPK